MVVRIVKHLSSYYTFFLFFQILYNGLKKEKIIITNVFIFEQKGLREKVLKNVTSLVKARET